MNAMVIHAKHVHIHATPSLASQEGSFQLLGGVKLSIAPPRFELHESGLVVTDNHTGLMWPVHESEKLHTFDESEAFAANLQLAGFGEWFNPSLEQRESIRDLKRFNPALFEPLKSRSNSWEWTSEPCAWSYEAGVPRAFWQVSGSLGGVGSVSRDGKAFSRPCRFVARPGQ